MKVEIGRLTDRMAPSGKAILKSIQNESLSIIDIVIREAFQNSLDATLDNNNPINIDVNIHCVKTQDISHYFDGVEESLNERYPNDSYVLAISDSNTTGLTGAIKTDEKEKLYSSNIYKLIYGINMNQESLGAGGSWGLGKTSYFRIGAGIVVYYSRIKNEEGKYEERLAANLIEDSSPDKNPLMPNNDRGVAWWGDKPKNSCIYDETYPITNENEIHSILNSFNLQPYKGNKTGTSIIIPFIDSEEILPSEENKQIDKIYHWEKSLESYINMSIQRWYFPRILNNEYSIFTGNSILNVNLNNEPITPLEYAPIFKKLLNLYNSAIVNKPLNESITVKELYVPRTAMKTPKIPVGWLAYTFCSKDEFNNTQTQLSPIPYLDSTYLIDNQLKGANVLTYSRKPGMIIEYVINESDWLKNIPILEDKYLLAFFVPNGSGEIHSSLKDKYNTLEDYLRATETADHAKWEDKHGITIIKRIKGQVSKALSEEYDDNDDSITSRRTSILSRKLGQKFMPPINYGTTGTHGPNDGTTRTGGGLGQTKGKYNRRTELLDILEVKILGENKLDVRFIIDIKSNKSKLVYIEVSSLFENLTYKDWNKNFDNSVDFPFIIDEVNIIKIDGIDSDYNIIKDIIVGLNIDTYADFDIINKSKFSLLIEIEMILIIKDATLKPTIKVKKLGDI